MSLSAGVFCILAGVVFAQLLPPLQNYRDDSIKRYLASVPSNSVSLLSHSNSESELEENSSLSSTIESSGASLVAKVSSTLEFTERKNLVDRVFKSGELAVPRISPSTIAKAIGSLTQSTPLVVTEKASIVNKNIDDGILFPTGVEMMPVAPTKLFPNMQAEYPFFDDDDPYLFSATSQTQYFGPNGQISYGPPEIVSMPSSLRAFKSCIFGCKQVTVPMTSTGTVGSTVILVLPFTIPCSLVSCPPCSTCVSSTISITVCPTIITTTPPPITATIFSFRSISSSSQPPITETVTVTRTRMPIGCPNNCRHHHHKSDYIDDSYDEKRFPIMTMQVDNINSVCSTFVICSPRHFTCPACHLGKTVDFNSIQLLLTQQEASSDSIQVTSMITSPTSLSDIVKVSDNAHADSSDDKSSNSSSESSKEKENDDEIKESSDHSSSSSSSSDSSMEKLKQKIEPNAIKSNSFKLAPSILPLIGSFLLLITL